MSLDLTLKNSQFNFKMASLRENKIYEFEEFRLDAAHLLLYHKNEEVSITPRAIETLLALLERRGEVVSKDELMKAVWVDTIVEESNLSQYLHLLRKTLGKRRDGKPFIETLKRRGYRFNGDVAVSENSNHFSPQKRGDAEKIENPLSDDVGETKNLNQHGRRVERRGNVLALVDWQSERDLVEEKTATQPTENRFKSKIFLIAAVALGAILLMTIPFFWFASNSKTSATRGDLTFTNLTNGEAVDYATISPDGNYFAYISHDGEKAHLWLQQTGQANRLEIIPPFAKAIYGTTFTPDSQFVYFVANENKGEPNALYRVPTLGGVKTKILTDIAAPVSFSPDGNEMTFMRGNRETNQSLLMIAASDGTRERILLTGKVGEAFFGGEWSPDGRLIAHGIVNLKKSWEGGCTIVGTDAQSGETKTLSPEKWDTCYRMAWTRDAQGLVFVGTKAKESFSTRRDQIYYLSLVSGESRRLTTDGSRHQIVSLGITDQDEVLAVPFNRSSQIWTMDARSGDSRTAIQITRGFADGRGGIAPLADGRIAYLTRHGDGFSIWLMNHDGSDRRQLTTDPPAIEELRAAPDGRFFIFAAQHDGWKHIYRIDADGANLRRLTFGESLETDSTVSPDGNWIVYDSIVLDDNQRKMTLWKIASDGGEPVRLTDADCHTPHFSPDGKFVSCVSPDWKKLLIISVADGAIFKTFETAENPTLNIGTRWTPDGKALAYIVHHQNVGNLRLQPINGDATRPLTDFTSGDIYNFAFSADGSRLYVARGYGIRNAVLIRNFR